MSELKATLLKEHKKYPLMTIKDLVKLVYQNTFAGGHMISQPANALDYLKKEYREMEYSKKERFESIGNHLIRINLEGIVKEGISLETINKWFVKTSNEQVGSIEIFEAKLEELLSLCETKSLPFEVEAVKKYLAQYKALGYPAVSHSSVYKETYEPHYRVIHVDYQNYYEIFLQIEKLLAMKSHIKIAIEGNSGSGKSYLAKLLEQTYGCNLFHMDDFFLSSDRKTPKRLGEPGGNIDYERFEKEVIAGIRKQEVFQYQLFDCKKGKLTEYIQVMPNRLNVIEGVYSLHPNYQDFYDLKIFLYTPESIQQSRILKRNGPYMLKRFQEEWIPLENQYFNTFKIKEVSDYIMNTAILEDVDGLVQ